MGIDDLKNMTLDDQTGEKKKGRGRPKGSTKKKDEPVQAITQPLPTQPSAAMIFIASLPFNMWSEAVKQEFVKLSKDETYQLALCYEQVAATYLPQVASKHLVLINALTVAGTLFASRAVGMSKINEAKRKAEKETKENEEKHSTNDFR